MAVNTTDAIDIMLKYKQTGSKELRNELVLTYGNLVKCIAMSTRNMYHMYAEVDDIVNEGIIALMSAIETFDINKNVKFETYATIRIRGAIIDFIRKQDFIPRSVRQFSRLYEKTFTSLYAELNREPTTKEIAQSMNMDEQKVRKLLGESANAQTLSFEELLYENNVEIPDAKNDCKETEIGIYKNELRSMLSKAIEELKDKERLVITLYYYEKLKFSEIAQVIGVTESRVCQIHSKSIVKIKYYLKDYIN